MQNVGFLMTRLIILLCQKLKSSQVAADKLDTCVRLFHVLPSIHFMFGQHKHIPFFHRFLDISSIFYIVNKPRVGEIL